MLNALKTLLIIQKQTVYKRKWPFPTLQNHIPLHNHTQLRKRYSNDTELLIQESAIRKTPSTEEHTLHSRITGALNWTQQYAHTDHRTAVHQSTKTNIAFCSSTVASKQTHLKI